LPSPERSARMGRRPAIPVEKAFRVPAETL